ncbi:MAG: GPP34 family phosphoprotein [bacterium]
MTFPPPVASGLAEQLLVLSLDPTDGRIRGGRGLDVSLRGALLAELALRNVVGTDGRAPIVVGEVMTGDRILDAVAATVHRRPGVAWRRWFRHVGVDRAALTARLLESGRWVAGPGRRRYADTDPQAADRLAMAVATAGATGPLVVTVLSELGAMPGPRSRKSRLRAREPALVARLTADGFSPATQAAVRDALAGAAAVRTGGLLPG